MNLFQDIQEIALCSGADFFGIADLTPARDAVVEQGGESLAVFTRAVAIGIVLPDGIVDMLMQHQNVNVARRYNTVYEDTNRKLDEISTSVADRLQKTGAKVLAIPASRQVDKDKLYGRFSHKTAAHLAGMGWIGKSCLLVTREAGPRVRWSTVLTDAPLSPSGVPVKQACGKCRLCVDVCPAQAFNGEPFRADQHRDVRFAARNCKTYVNSMTRKTGIYFLCGLCVSVCPHGK